MMRSQPMIDTASPTWRQLEPWLQDRLEQCRTAIEDRHDIVDTSMLRGQIGILRQILALGEPARVSQTGSTAA